MIHPISYPTTAILVGAKGTFLHTLKPDAGAVYQTFYDLAPALTYCVKESIPIEMRQNDLPLDIDPARYSQILKTALLNPNRFAAISVIVIDLSMPHLLDVEWIDQLRQTTGYPFIRIVVVAGGAGYELAVELLNRQKIDSVLLKNEISLEEKISDIIVEMQRAYLFGLYQAILNTVPEKITAILNDVGLIDFFAKITQKLKICEYYLCENTGDFVLIDREGAYHILVLRTKNDLSLYAELATKQGSSSELIRRISIGRILPFFGMLDSVSASRENWIVNTYPAKKIVGAEDYYYALISNKKTAILPCIQAVTSFAAYKGQNEQQFAAEGSENAKPFLL